MLFDSKENKCVLEVLQLLTKNKSKYSEMFRKTKVSHTTLQRVLRQLVQKKFITRNDIGHQNVNYEITSKGRQLSKQLLQLQGLF